MKSKEENSQDFFPKHWQEFGLWIARLQLQEMRNPRLLDHKHLRIQLSKRTRHQIAYISVGGEAYNDIEYCNT